MKATRILNTLAVASIMAFSSVSAFADMSKTQVEGIVHDYLIKNPDVVVQALQTFQQQQMSQARKTMEKTQEFAPKYAKDLFHAKDPMAGNPNGKITVVEFFDYQCPHCVEMTPVIEAVIKSNPDVRIVFKEFPIRGPASEIASRAALAAQMQGKYFELHKALMAANRTLNEADIMAIAKSVGLNIDKLKADMNGDVVNQELKTNTKLAQDLQLIGTPAFFIAKSDVTSSAPASAVVFIPGQIDQAQLETMIKKVSG